MEYWFDVKFVSCFKWKEFVCSVAIGAFMSADHVISGAGENDVTESNPTLTSHPCILEIERIHQNLEKSKSVTTFNRRPDSLAEWGISK